MTAPSFDLLRAFHRTPPLPCPYLGGRLESRIFTALAGAHAEADYELLAEAGFRRSHGMVYRPACPACRACVPVRVVVHDFAPGRTMRRLHRINADLAVRELPPRATEEHYALFRRYQDDRHGDGDMARMTFAEYRAMVEETPVDTVLFEWRADDGRLAAVCLADRLRKGLSAVYSFFEPEGTARRSLGTYTVLWLIEQARREGRPYVYLGYWIRECRKMAYKTRFRPLEGLRDGAWRRLEAERG